MFRDIEQLIDSFHWSASEIKALVYRERKHWVARCLYKLEQEYERMHLANNTNQTITRSVGQGVTFNGIPYR